MAELNFAKGIDIFLWSQYSMLYSAGLEPYAEEATHIQVLVICASVQLNWAISLVDPYCSDD
jgi:hypothetical protein